MKKLAYIVVMLIVMTVPVMAQELNPGITPDSPFYFLDRMFDVFQTRESVANERAAEVLVMAQTGNAKGLAKATEGYARAMEKRQAQAQNNPQVAEDVARQASTHLIALAAVRSRVPAQAQASVDTALTRSAQGRENALGALERQNPERAALVAQETLQRVMQNTPEQAQEGLLRALTAMTRRGQPATVVGQAVPQNGRPLTKLPDTSRVPVQGQTQGSTVSAPGQQAVSRAPVQATDRLRTIAATQGRR